MGTILSKLMAVIIAIVCTINLVPANNNTQKTETPKNNTQIVEERQEDPAADSDIELVEEKAAPVEEVKEEKTEAKAAPVEEEEKTEAKAEVEAPAEEAPVEENELQSTGKEEVKETANYEVVETFDISATPQDDVTLTLYAVPQMARAATFTANNEDEIAVCGLEDEEEAVESKAHVNYLTSYSDEDTVVEAFISGNGNMEENVYKYFVNVDKYIATLRRLVGAQVGLTADQVRYTLPAGVTDLIEVDAKIKFYADADCSRGPAGIRLFITDEVVEQINPAEILEFNVDKITFEGNITSISDGAFLFCNDLTEVVLPDTIKTIGANAFSYCANLQRVVLNDGLEEIGYGAFMYCKNLKEIIIPTTLTTVGEDAFLGIHDDARIICNPKSWGILR